MLDDNKDKNTLSGMNDTPETRDYILYLEGAFEGSKGNYEKAVSLLTESANLNPHFKTYEMLYVCLNRLGKFDEGFECLERAYELNPRNNKTASFYAREVFKRGDEERTRKILNKILEQNSTYGPARRLLNEINSK